MERLKIAAGNWKMNKTLDAGAILTEALVKEEFPEDVQVVLGTPFIHLYATHQMIKDKPQFWLAAQNCHQEESGAFTGEISAAMLKSVGVDFVILGHSERRAYFNEDNALLLSKVRKVLAHKMRPIFCCGEPLPVRKEEEQNNFVERQLTEVLFELDPEEMKQIVIAYEPIWAIGTGVTASPEQAQEMHAHIRQLLARKFGADIAEGTSILYGGSVKPANAAELFANPDVDGGLVGGASLKAADFADIIRSF